MILHDHDLIYGRAQGLTLDMQNEVRITYPQFPRLGPVIVGKAKSDFS